MDDTAMDPHLDLMIQPLLYITEPTRPPPHHTSTRASTNSETTVSPRKPWFSTTFAAITHLIRHNSTTTNDASQHSTANATTNTQTDVQQQQPQSQHSHFNHHDNRPLKPIPETIIQPSPDDHNNNPKNSRHASHSITSRQPSLHMSPTEIDNTNTATIGIRIYPRIRTISTKLTHACQNVIAITTSQLRTLTTTPSAPSVITSSPSHPPSLTPLKQAPSPPQHQPTVLYVDAAAKSFPIAEFRSFVRFCYTDSIIRHLLHFLIRVFHATIIDRGPSTVLLTTAPIEITLKPDYP